MSYWDPLIRLSNAWVVGQSSLFSTFCLEVVEEEATVASLAMGESVKSLASNLVPLVGQFFMVLESFLEAQL